MYIICVCLNWKCLCLCLNWLVVPCWCGTMYGMCGMWCVVGLKYVVGGVGKVCALCVTGSSVLTLHLGYTECLTPVFLQ